MNIQTADPFRWLAVTKFRPPEPGKDVISRDRLVSALQESIHSHPLTLLSAQAGYGKSTLLAAFVRRYSNFPSAWLSLDEEDNDPARFLSALIASLQQLDPECGRTAQTLLEDISRSGLEPRRVMSVLINDIQETIPDLFVLILDDLHLIVEAAIFDALNYLLERLPEQMRLVMASRTDPPLALSRIRARGGAAELHPIDLKFTTEESAAFLNDKLGLKLSLEELDHLHSRTEGWPAALRLLAGSLGQMSSEEDRTAFIHHFVRSEQYIFDFLAEEVLNRQEPEVRSFLLKTSILPELTPNLCQAVTGRPDAQAVIEDLFRRNLLIVASERYPEHLIGRVSSLPGKVSTASPSFRYHALFNDFLRYRLQQEMPGNLSQLHLLAAKAENIPGRAIGHFLAAAEWHEAAKIIERVGRDTLGQGLLDTLTNWITGLPTEILEKHPILVHLSGLCAWQRGELATAQKLLERALVGYDQAHMVIERSEALVDLASCAFLLADFPKSDALYTDALTSPIRPDTRLRVLMERASLGVFLERWQQAQEDFAAAVGLVKEPLDPETARTIFYHLVPGQVILPGAIDQMERFCRLALSLISNEVSPMRVHFEGWMVLIHGWRGRWSKALVESKRVLAMNERLGGQLFAGMDVAAVVIAACGAIGAYEEAEPYLDLLFHGVKHMDFAEMYIAAFLFVPGRLLWMQGRLVEARQVYERMLQAKNPRELPVARVMRAWMKALLEAADGRYASAERTLRQPFVLEQEDRISTLWGSTRLMLARLYQEQNRQQEAMRELEIALPYYERMGWPGSLTVEGFSIVPLLRLAIERDVQARFAFRLLDLLGAIMTPEPVYVPQTSQTLTRREVEVLQLICAGASNQDIVDKLVISISTVKAHVSHILAKLDVSNRNQAASRAREWRLL